MQFPKILLLPKVHSLPLGFRYLVFRIPFECDQVSNFLKILGLHDKLLKKKTVAQASWDQYIFQILNLVSLDS